MNEQQRYDVPNTALRAMARRLRNRATYLRTQSFSWSLSMARECDDAADNIEQMLRSYIARRGARTRSINRAVIADGGPEA